MFKNFVTLVSVFVITITATGYGQSVPAAERAAKILCCNSAAQILGKDTVRPISIKSKVVGNAEGYGKYCVMTMEVE